MKTYRKVVNAAHASATRISVVLAFFLMSVLFSLCANIQAVAGIIINKPLWADNNGTYHA
jgi:hypothetical protein